MQRSVFSLVLLNAFLLVFGKVTHLQVCNGRKQSDVGMLKELTVNDQLQCSRECLESQECLSANFIRRNSGNICQLLRENESCEKLPADVASVVIRRESFEEGTCHNGGMWNESASRCTNCSGFTYGQFCNKYVKDCKEANSNASSQQVGTYVPVLIQPSPGHPPFWVNCRLKYGGLLYWARRNPDADTMNFTRRWEDYKNGFGDLTTFNGDFFLGLDKMNIITNHGNFTLLIWLVTVGTREGGIRYHGFNIGTEASDYNLKYLNHDSFLHPYTADDSFGQAELNGTSFCTYDRNCGNICVGTQNSGWWFNGLSGNCSDVNLNAPKGSVKWPMDGALQNIAYFDLQLI